MEVKVVWTYDEMRKRLHREGNVEMRIVTGSVKEDLKEKELDGNEHEIRAE